MKFAHLADIHLGFNKDDALFKEECRIFNQIIDDCITNQVDFIILAGDIFHTNIPEMRVQKNAFSTLAKVKNAGIPIYTVYGSHDFSPVHNSVIDLLDASGIITKMQYTTHDDGSIELHHINGPKNSIITGLHGLKVGKDIEWYKNLKTDNIPTNGKRIFIFHGGLEEFTSQNMLDGVMPVALLPKGYSYYAGGHFHHFNTKSFPDHKNVTYSGTTFSGNTADIEDNAKGAKRGYVLVDWDDNDNISVKFQHIENVEYILININCKNMTIEEVNKKLEEDLNKHDVTDKVVFMKFYGRLIEKSKASGLDFNLIHKKTEKALWRKVIKNIEDDDNVMITESTNMIGKTIEEIEKKALDEEGLRLLQILKQPRLADEKALQYSDRIDQEALRELKLTCI